MRRGERRMSAEARFWNKVDKSGNCWVWTAHHNPDGYGRFRIGDKFYSAHRVAWEKENGPIPAGMCVLHRCDNPPCVRVSHLFLGTNSDNVQDCLQKGRHPNAQKTHCPRGHRYNEENTTTYQRPGRSPERQCRVCNRERMALVRAK